MFRPHSMAAVSVDLSMAQTNRLLPALCAEDPYFQDPQRPGHVRARGGSRGLAPQLLELLPTHLVPSHGPGGGQLVRCWRSWASLLAVLVPAPTS